MKLHLLFVFLLAAPLLGRLLSGDASSSVDGNDSANSNSSEVQSTAPAAPVRPPASTSATISKIVPAAAHSADKPASTSAPAPRQAHGRRASHAQAFTFM